MDSETSKAKKVVVERGEEEKEEGRRRRVMVVTAQPVTISSSSNVLGGNICNVTEYAEGTLLPVYELLAKVTI